MKEENYIFKIYNSVFKRKSSKLEKEIISEDSVSTDDVIKKYEKSFQKFPFRSLGRSIMDSMIYGVRRNSTRGIGYDSYEESDYEKEDKPNNIVHYYFLSIGSDPKVKEKGKTLYVPKAKPKEKSCFKNVVKYVYLAPKPKVVNNSGKTNKKGA